MSGFRIRAVQFPVQLPTAMRRCETVRPYPSQGVSPRVRVSHAPPDLATRTLSRALVAVTEMTTTEIRSITERIEARLELDPVGTRTQVLRGNGAVVHCG